MSKATPGYLGPYRLLNVVHTSRTGKIWQAIHDGKQQQMFGVKTLSPEFAKDREELGYLRREYEVGQKLDHKRVIRTCDYGTDRGIPYVAMEWFPAPNMKKRIADGIGSIAHLLPKIIENAAAGLGYLNSQGWVHRDVKPDNFLVADDGDVKLIDLALATRSRGGLAKLFSMKSKVQGTRSYMSPEQIRGKAVDTRSDIYNFGCTIYHLMVGHPPFTGTSTNELLNKHLKAAPPSIGANDDNITPEFSQLVRRMMAKNPADRPASISDFLTEFRMIRVFHRIPRPVEPTK